MRHFLITVRVRRGSSQAVRRILREGPPFDLDETSLERHLVFLAGNELVFLFEGPHAEEEAGRLLARPTVFGQASRLRAHLAGRPRSRGPVTPRADRSTDPKAPTPSKPLRPSIRAVPASTQGGAMPRPPSERRGHYLHRDKRELLRASGRWA